MVSVKPLSLSSSVSRRVDKEEMVLTWRMDDGSLNDSESSPITNNLHIASTSIPSASTSINLSVPSSDTHTGHISIHQLKDNSRNYKFTVWNKSNTKDKFASIIKALAKGELSIERIKQDNMVKHVSNDRKMYWEEVRYNHGLITPSLDVAFMAHTHQRKAHWDKGITFGVAKRVLATDECIHDNSIYDSVYDDTYLTNNTCQGDTPDDDMRDSVGGEIVWDGVRVESMPTSMSVHRHKVGQVHNRENIHSISENMKHREEVVRDMTNVYPFNTIVEVFDRKRVLRPFASISKFHPPSGYGRIHRTYVEVRTR